MSPRFAQHSSGCTQRNLLPDCRTSSIRTALAVRARRSCRYCARSDSTASPSSNSIIGAPRDSCKCRARRAPESHAMKTTAGRVLIVAEAGVNHNGSLELACRLIDVAAAAGADAVKFQSFRADAVASAGAGKAHYQTLTTSAAETQLEMLSRLQLSEADHPGLVARARR